jgi:hypothetical protein
MQGKSRFEKLGVDRRMLKPSVKEPVCDRIDWIHLAQKGPVP